MIDLSLLQDFIPEAMEHLEEMESNLIRLESEPENRHLLNNIFRAAHTIKGSSEYMGMKKIAGLAHKMESLLDALRSSGISADRIIIDILMASRDRIVTLVGELEKEREEKSEISDLIERMERFLFKGGMDATGGQATSDHSVPEPAADNIKKPTMGARAENGVFDGAVKKIVTGLKSALIEASSKGISETRKRLILDYLLQLSKADAGEHSGDMGQALDAIKIDVKAMVYPDDAGDVLASVNKLLAKFNYIRLEEENIEIGEPNDDSESDFFDDGEIDAEIAEATDSLFDDDPGKSDDDHDFEEPEAGLSSVPDIDEVYDEEYDEELFGIFMDHLKENFEKLDHQITLSVHSDNVSEILNHCYEMVNGLQSSASYMDYKGLTDLYENLKKELETTIASAEQGRVVSLEFVRSYLKRVSGRFPKYEKGLLEIIEAKADTRIPDAIKDTTVVVQETPVRKVTVKDRPEKPVIDTSAEETQGLFEELDNVFDNHIESAGESVDEEPFDGDIEDMLSSMGSAPPAPGRITSKPEPDLNLKSAVYPETFDTIEPPASKQITEEGLLKKAAEISIKPAPIPDVVESKQEERPEVLDTKPVDSETEDHEIIKVYNDSTSSVAETASKKDESGSMHYDYTGEKIVKQSLRVDTRKIDSLMNQVGELVVSRASYSQLSVEMRELEQILKQLPGVDSKEIKRVRNLSFRIGEATVALGRVANDLQEGVMKVRMLPIAQLFNRYPRLIRDLVHDTDKKIRLEMKGEETELDKMVIEQIADPMIHIIRNAVDHGIETATERLAKGKPEEASITLESYHESNHVVVEIMDDGRGIDTELIKKEALRKNFTTVEELERLNNREVISLIMRPGFSTVSEVTKTSGRGVGMDVVKKNIEKLNGTIDIESIVGEGTRVRIKIPLTMAIIQALLVRVGKEIFTIPLSSVEETIRTHEDSISIIDGVEVIHLRNSTLSLLRLTEIFGTQSTTQDLSRPYVVVVNTGMKRVGLVVDGLIGQEETVIKPLADYLQENSGFSGATILGDGSISLILDVYELVNLTISKRSKNKDFSGSYSSIITDALDEKNSPDITIQ